MTTHQLHWASIQAAETAGNTSRADRAARTQDQTDSEALVLIAWLDSHVTRRP